MEILSGEIRVLTLDLGRFGIGEVLDALVGLRVETDVNPVTALFNPAISMASPPWVACQFTEWSEAKSKSAYRSCV